MISFTDWNKKKDKNIDDYVIVITKTSIKVFRSNRGRPDDTGG